MTSPSLDLNQRSQGKYSSVIHLTIEFSNTSFCVDSYLRSLVNLSDLSFIKQVSLKVLVGVQIWSTPSNGAIDSCVKNFAINFYYSRGDGMFSKNN
jgi:hypothetical protein